MCERDLPQSFSSVISTSFNGSQKAYTDILSFERMLLGLHLNNVDRALLRCHQTAYEHDSVQSWWPMAARGFTESWSRSIKTVGKHSFDCA